MGMGFADKKVRWHSRRPRSRGLRAYRQTSSKIDTELARDEEPREVLCEASHIAHRRRRRAQWKGQCQDNVHGAESDLHGIRHKPVNHVGSSARDMMT